MIRAWPDKHGIVEGSVDNVRSEESFLCERLLREYDLERNDISEVRWLTHNNAIPSVTQGRKRPVCGLVALCMAGHMLQEHDPTVKIYENHEEILTVAKNMGFTKQGEMFSAKEYACLAQRVLNCDCCIHTRTLATSWVDILAHITAGYPVLVPYDSDRNCEPCLKKGHRAHWAILTGYMLGITDSSEATADEDITIEKISQGSELSRILDNSHPCTKNTEQPLLYVYAKQGKSAKQQLWSLNDLSESNANLVEISSDRDPSQYHIPAEGIREALCTKSVLLYPKSPVL